VGSGKTVVAVLSSAVAVDSGVQCAIMAPTEILAVQHFDSFKKFSKKSPLSCELLIGKTPPKERTVILKKLKEKKIDVIIGTHALIQKDVQFKSLGLVIVDEQHRFGVVQRGDLISKGHNPHFLAMTATPIPRTLTITYHGDMECSILDEMPKNRKPVKTRVVQPMKLEKVYQYMKSEMDAGKQCMIVYPLVEETEKSDLKAAEEAFVELSDGDFSDFSTGLLHGRMKKDKKNDIMENFSKNEIHLLISTTVIEVGIDVPNATVMVVEHADRFGLTQLHQLRGRVGRGTEKSVCVLVQRKFTESGLKRLQIMEGTNDGFKIADEDLLMRGPGAFFSSKQSGFLKYRIADLVRDKAIIREARKAAFQIIEKDPHLRKPEHEGVRNKFIQEYRSLLQDIKIN
jgi:ATP-dependent DNA helicase RecG